MKFTTITIGAVAALSTCVAASQQHNNVHRVHVKKIVQVEKRAFGDVKQEAWGQGAFGGVVQEQPWPEADAQPTATYMVWTGTETSTKTPTKAPTKKKTADADKEKAAKEKAAKEKAAKEKAAKEKAAKEAADEAKEEKERKPMENNIEEEGEKEAKTTTTSETASVETVSVESTTTMTETVIVTVTSTRPVTASATD